MSTVRWQMGLLAGCSGVEHEKHLLATLEEHELSCFAVHELQAQDLPIKSFRHLKVGGIKDGFKNMSDFHCRLTLAGA